MKQFFTLAVLLFSFSQITLSQQSLLDPSFGDEGIVKTDMGSTFDHDNLGKQVLVQSDGSIYLVIGEGDEHPAQIFGAYPTVVAKIHSDGSADVSYGSSGLSASVSIFGAHAAMQTDGKIIIAGYMYGNDQYSGHTYFAVARLNTDGSLDGTFGEEGIQLASIDTYNQVNSVAIQDDGKIVVAGSTYDHYGFFDTRLALVRFNQDGSLDQTFNGTGTVKKATDLAWANSVAIQSDGKIAVAGQLNYIPTVIRYNENGSVDPAFDGGLSIMGFGSSDNINSIAVQSDGKIVATGYKKNGNVIDFAAVRLNIDGSPDITFDGDGYQTTDFGGTNDTSISVAIQSDGKIVLAGYSSSGGATHFAICRYNTDGSLDNTFNVNGKQTTVFGSANSYANSLAVQADGKIVAMGYKNDGIKSEAIAARYNADGSPDNSFGESGTLTNYIEQGDTHFTSTVIQNDGKVVAAGSAWNGSNYDFSLVRYNTDGTLDNTFATEGKQMTDFGNTDDVARAVVIQSDGKFLLAGSAGDNFAIARYNSDGRLDNTFGVNGMQASDFGYSDYAISMKLQNDGKIVVGGTSLARYNANGSPDMSFGTGGKVWLPSRPGTGSSFIGNDIAIQSDNKIVVVSDNFDGNWEMVARYNTDGSLDNTFGRNGLQFITAGGALGQPILVGTSVKIGNDGKIIIGGYGDNTDKLFLLLKLQSNGSPDYAFGSHKGIVFANPGAKGVNYATSMLVESDDKIILAGYSYNEISDNFTIMRFNADGSPDITFSGDGIEITNASSAYNRIAGIALSDESLYAVGYGQYPGNLGVVAKYLLPSGGPLPVTLTDFTATLKINHILLQWQTVSEHGLSHFAVEHSANGNNFSSISNVDALGNGNNNTKINYSAIDDDPSQGTNYYRLKSVDIDGKFTYSKVIAVNSNGMFTIRISPNPASNMLFLQATGNNEKANYQIIDMEGRKLKEATIVLDNNTLHPIDISGLSKGNYIINIQTKTRKESMRFIKD